MLKAQEAEAQENAKQEYSSIEAGGDITPIQGRSMNDPRKDDILIPSSKSDVVSRNDASKDRMGGSVCGKCTII